MSVSPETSPENQDVENALLMFGSSKVGLSLLIVVVVVIVVFVIVIVVVVFLVILLVSSPPA